MMTSYARIGTAAVPGTFALCAADDLLAVLLERVAEDLVEAEPCAKATTIATVMAATATSDPTAAIRARIGLSGR